MTELINLSNELVHKTRIYEDYRPGTLLLGSNDALLDGYYLLFDNYNVYRDPMHSVNFDNVRTYYSLTRSTGFEFAFNSKNNVMMLNSSTMSVDPASRNLTPTSNTSYHFDITRFKTYFMSNIKSIFGVFDHSVNNFDIANNSMYTTNTQPSMVIGNNATEVGLYNCTTEYYSTCNLNTYQRIMHLNTSTSGYIGYILENIELDSIFKKLYVKYTYTSVGSTLSFKIKTVDRRVNTITQIYEVDLLVDETDYPRYSVSYSNISNIIDVGPNKYMAIPKYVEDEIGLKIGYTLFVIDDVNISKIGDYFADEYDIYFSENTITYRGTDLINRLHAYIKIDYDVETNLHTVMIINKNTSQFETALYKSFKLAGNSTAVVNSKVIYNHQRFNNTAGISTVHLVSADTRYIVLKYNGYIYAGIWNNSIREYIFSNIAYSTDYIVDFNNRKFILTDRDKIFVEPMYSSEYEIYITFDQQYYKYLGEDISASISVACIAVDKLIDKELILKISGDCVFTATGLQTMQMTTSTYDYYDINVTITGPSVINVYSEII